MAKAKKQAEPEPDLLDELRQQEIKCRAAESRWRSLKETCKEAKVDFEAELAELRSMIRGAENDETRPLLTPPGVTGTSTPEGIRAHDPDAAKAAQIRERAEIINDGSENCLACKGMAYSYGEGQTALAHGQRLEDCPHDPGAGQDDWIRGFLGAELLERYEPAAGGELNTTNLH